MLEMLRAGITCFSDMYFFPEITAREARKAGLRAQIAFPVIDFANAWSENADQAIHKGLALADEYRHDSRLLIAFGPHSATTVSQAALTRVAMYAEELDLAVQIHLHENAADVAENRQLLGASGIEYLQQLGLLGPNLQAVHVTRISDSELELLQAGNVQVVHCPTSNARLACGIAPVVRLLQAGVNVALGTDGAASNHHQSILGEARLASLLAKLAAEDAAALPAAAAFDMATINGARALGLEAVTGSLAVGKSADMIAIDMRAPQLQPLYDPLAQLIHGAAESQVTHVWVAGECLLRERAPSRFDEQEILARAAYWQQQITTR
jgi:5-methylthioadenosine/S-adenosylhomocysteine deaminase